MQYLFFCPIVLFAQKPFINNISPTHVEVGETVTISGSNLSGTPQVFFGGVEAGSVDVISGNLIKATVPAGTTQGSIIVLNNGLIAQSSQHFFISFSGFDIATYDPEYLVSTTEQAASNICICDLDEDDKNDIVIVHNGSLGDPNEVTIFRNNTSSIGSLTGPTDFQLDQTLNNTINESGFNSVSCGDLDNDGDRDLAFTSNLGTNSRDIYVYRNTSTPGTITLNELDIISLTLPVTSDGDQRIPGSIAIADMDRDGLADLVVGNNTDNTFHIFKNTGSLNFSNAVEITANNEPTGILDVSDFNNDGHLDVVTLTFRESNTGIHFFKNSSSIDNFNFEYQETVSNGGQNSDIVSGDIDNDGFNDIVVASNLTGLISVFRNQGTTNQISFGILNNVTTTGTSASGVTLADLNGDGKLDIANSNATGNIHIFENTSPEGSISFDTEVVRITTSTTGFIVSGDLDGDAKPDLAYTQKVQPTEVGNLAIILNRNCVEPQLSPGDAERSFCDMPETFTLTVTQSPEATYNWEVVSGNNIGGNSFSTTTNISPLFQIMNGATSATIRVTMMSADGFCTTEFDMENYNIFNSVTGIPTITSSPAGVLCVGDNATLSGDGTYDNHFWVMPDGNTSTSRTIDLNPISSSDAGTYTLRVQNSGSCSSEEATINIEVSRPPLLEIINNNLDNFCTGTNVSLEVPDFTGDFTYEWRRDGSDITPSNVASILANQSGNYTVAITDGTTCETETAIYSISSIELPASVSNGPTETCVDFLTSFTSASTGQGSFALQYEWVVEDASDVVIHTATTPDLDYTFPSTGNYEVILNTNYDPTEVYSRDICVSSDPISVTVSAAPAAITFDQIDLAVKCQAESLLVGITSPNSETISTYNWTIRNASDNSALSTATTNTVNVSTEVGIDTVWAVIDLTTTIGCQVKDSIRIRNFESDIDISSSDFISILEFDTALLEEATSISLLAVNAVSDISWTPDINFTNPSEASTVYFPKNPISTVTLTAMDANGCLVSTEVKIVLDNIRPKKTFSPNGDAINDCWEILNIGDLGNGARCKVYVFDSRGKNILTKDDFEANSNCVWDGNFNNSPVPEGIYYYVLKCNDNNFTKSGSVLLAR